MTDLEATALADLAFFADLGTEAPRVTQHEARSVVRIVRNGREIEIVLHLDGTIEERDEDGERRHADMRALLASSNFGDIGRWADAQSAFLRTRIEKDPIPIHGIMSGHDETVSLDQVDEALAANDDDPLPQVRVVLVDGPAGIGKTTLIRRLAYRRASEYRQRRHPLILHVESRGRMLQNIMDLMAFSLQTLRLNVTYDQVPVLVRRGLVTLAIDGFDELGDPSGYELAWAQVNQLVDEARGRGSLLLAGRETFIGRNRLVEALTSLDSQADKLQTFTVVPVTPDIAVGWLASRGWTDDLFKRENVEPLFEEGSYALRPFFLSELARDDLRTQVTEGEIEDLTWFLVETMMKREATKFGRDVESITNDAQRYEFVSRFLEEVARDLAENQTDAIASDSIAWIAEMVASETIPSNLTGIMRNRASVIAFLTDDDRRGYRRFSHGQILNHFIARVTVQSVVDGEVPKYIRRNILGADFLVSFIEVARNVGDDQLRKFVENAVGRIGELGDQDRSRRNLASLVLASTSALDSEVGLVLADVGIDEALVVGYASNIALVRVSVAQLDAREAICAKLYSMKIAMWWF